MALTPKDVFDSDKEIIEFFKELVKDKEYEFLLKGFSIPIRIHLYRIPGQRGIFFKQSHYIKTPTQLDAYITSRPCNDDVGSALWQAVSGITRFYKEAVKAEYNPNDNWLIPSERFL